MSKFPINSEVLNEALRAMDITDIAATSIRQSGDLARILGHSIGAEFLHLEMGTPGLEPSLIGIEAESEALKSGIASIYPVMTGIEPLKTEASRFIKAFLDVDIDSRGCIPTVGSMQGSFSLFLLISKLFKESKKILFIDPGFSVQKVQTHLLGVESESFDIYNYRGEALRPKLESLLEKGDVSALIYSNPNNPAWFSLTEEELQIIGELATKYDTIVIEDLAYLCMDFRKPLGRPFETPYQSTVARYTKNYILLISASKIFSYAGQRIAVTVIPDELYDRNYSNLKEVCGLGRLGDAFVSTVLYAVSSGVTHSVQYGLAAMFKAASDGRLDFVANCAEYAHRASLSKSIFLRNGFHIVYEKDGDEPIADGFFFTVGYRGMSSGELLKELIRYGICTISLTTTGSFQPGVRVCVSQLNRERDFELLEERLSLFAANNG